jgi:hypothetical protein
MTEPTPSRPVPGPPSPEPPAEGADGGSFAGLEQLPVADHVAVFEAEHSRLQDELSTIDQV